MALLGLVGVKLSLEQLYFQQAPQAMMPGCLPPIDYLVDVLSLAELVTAIFSITGECAGIHPAIAGISLPLLLLGLFVAVSLFGLWVASGNRKVRLNPARRVALNHEKNHNEPQNK